MGKFTVTHEINCNVDTFWQVFLDKTFNEKLYLEGLSFPEFKILDQKETDTTITRLVRARPKVDMPAPIAKALGPNFGYDEDATFNKAKKEWTWKMKPNTLADKLKQEGVCRATAVGDNKVRRVAELTIEAKVMLIGGLMESTAEKQLREGWDKSAVFMNKYLQSMAK